MRAYARRYALMVHAGKMRLAAPSKRRECLFSCCRLLLPCLFCAAARLFDDDIMTP